MFSLSAPVDSPSCLCFLMVDVRFCGNIAIMTTEQALNLLSFGHILVLSEEDRNWEACPLRISFYIRPFGMFSHKFCFSS